MKHVQNGGGESIFPPLSLLSKGYFYVKNPSIIIIEGIKQNMGEILHIPLYTIK